MFAAVVGRTAATARALFPDHVYVAVRPRVEGLLGLRERELSYLLRHVRTGPRRRFIDVGANWGSYTVLLAPSFERVEAFEPIARLATALARYATTDRERIRVHGCALSDRNETVELLVPENDVVDASGRSRIVEVASAATVPVPARTLDSFGFDDVDLVKIDVEGHERSVLCGGLETIHRCRPTLVVEIAGCHFDEPFADRIAFVESLGYRGSFLREGRLVSLREFVLARDQVEANLGKGDRFVNNFIFEPVRAAAA